MSRRAWRVVEQCRWARHAHTRSSSPTSASCSNASQHCYPQMTPLVQGQVQGLAAVVAEEEEEQEVVAAVGVTWTSVAVGVEAAVALS